MACTTVDESRAIGFFDISGSTVLWHEARSRDQDEDNGQFQAQLTRAFSEFFSDAIKNGEKYGIQFANTNGDGFLTVSHSLYWSRKADEKDPNYHPAQVMHLYVGSIKKAFEKNIRSVIDDQRYVCRRSVDLRVALHFGLTHLLCIDNHSHFFGDSLNYASRLLDSGVARRKTIATSSAFFARFHRTKKRIGVPVETLTDRNKYPEPIEVYDLYDADNAGFRIERVRVYPQQVEESLKKAIFNASKLTNILSVHSLESEVQSSSSCSYRFVPKHSDEPTLIEFIIESTPGKGDSKSTTKLKMIQTGFEKQLRTTWIKEIQAWEKRLSRLENRIGMN